MGGPQHLHEGGDAQFRAAGDGDASRRPGDQSPGGGGQDDRAQTVSKEDPHNATSAHHQVHVVIAMRFFAGGTNTTFPLILLRNCRKSTYG